MYVVVAEAPVVVLYMYVICCHLQVRHKNTKKVYAMKMLSKFEMVGTTGVHVFKHVATRTERYTIIHTHVMARVSHLLKKSLYMYMYINCLMNMW